MIKRNLYSILTGFALFITLAGCDESAPTAVLDEVNAEALAPNAQVIPHRGNIFFYPINVEPTDDPLVILIEYEGEGEALQFGQFTETGKYLLHSDNAGTPLFISDVVATRTAANGDQVSLANVTGAISLTGDPAHPTVLEGEFDYEDGTGRFAGVSGHFRWRAVGNPDGSALSNFVGTISTPGSKR